jgi:hypothetical protein
MTPSAALRRVIEDDSAPEPDRCKALRRLKKPPLCMLRRLLVRSATRKIPVPSALYSLAALIYAKEVEARKKKKQQSQVQPRRPAPWKSAARPIRNEDDELFKIQENALGIT